MIGIQIIALKLSLARGRKAYIAGQPGIRRTRWTVGYVPARDEERAHDEQGLGWQW